MTEIDARQNICVEEMEENVNGASNRAHVSHTYIPSHRKTNITNNIIYNLTILIDDI